MLERVGRNVFYLLCDSVTKRRKRRRETEKGKKEENMVSGGTGFSDGKGRDGRCRLAAARKDRYKTIPKASLPEQKNVAAGHRRQKPYSLTGMRGRGGS